MGVGKTILVSNLVAHLHAPPRNQADIISYYFCRSDDEESLRARNIIGSLSCQMLNTQIERANGDTLSDLYHKSQDLDTEDVIDLVTSRLEDDKTYYVILDGVDECESNDVRDVARGLASLCDKRVKDLKILCSGRPELEKELFRTHKPKYKMALTEQKVESDMDRYIDTTLHQCLEDGHLKLSDPRLILNIEEALRKGSDGMFLWTRLTINEICAQPSDKEILNALEHLPRGLSKLLDQKMGRVKEQNCAQDAIKTLQYCGVAKRPLTIDELREALRIVPGQKSLDRPNLPNNMDRLIADCCGLTVVDEEDETVHLVHHSVRKYLFTAQGPHLHQFIEADVDKHVGFLCMTYINFNDFERQVVKVTKSTHLPLDPLKLGVGSVTQPNSISNRVALTLLRHRRQHKHLTAGEVGRNLQEMLGDSETLRRALEKQQFAFFNYARTYWIHHLMELDNGDEKMWKLFCRCVDGNDIITSRPWDEVKDEKQRQFNDMHKTQRLLLWALNHGHTALLLQLVSLKSEFLSKESKGVILHYAVQTDKLHLMESIVGCIENKRETLAPELVSAAEDGRFASITIMLAGGGDANSSFRHLTALQAAAAGGHVEVVERLLAAKADVNAPAAEYGGRGRTALQAAAEGGHVEVMERLLAAKADVNAPADEYGGRGRTALQAAAEGGHVEVVERLLAAKADVNAPAAAEYGRTALQAAAEGGHVEVVERLLAAKADVNAPAANSIGRTALEAAAKGGHLEVVERLREAGARN